MSKKTKTKKLIFVLSVILLSLCLMPFFVKIASAIVKDAFFDFNKVQTQILDTKTPYSYSEGIYKLDFYGKYFNDETFNNSAFPLDVDKLKKDGVLDYYGLTTISTEGFTFYEASTLPNNQYQNYIKINPFMIDSVLRFSYKPLKEKEIISLQIHKDSPDGEVVSKTTSPVTDEDGTLSYSVIVNEFLKAGSTYYILLENPYNNPFSGLSIKSLRFYCDDGTIPQPDNPEPTPNGNSPVSIGNNGYPYCDIWSATASSITIDFDDGEGTYKNSYWQECPSSTSAGTAPSNSWTKVPNSDKIRKLRLASSGAEAGTYDALIKDKYWYRVVLETDAGNVYSKSVQTVQLTNHQNTWWYLGNGRVATGSNSSYGFDVLGRRGDGGSYSYNSYNGRGTYVRTYNEIYCTKADEEKKIYPGIPLELREEHDMEAIKFSFKEDMPYVVNTAFRVKDKVAALSVDQDTDVGGVDSAMFRVYLNPVSHTLQQLQLVSKSSGQIGDSDFAYVMSFSDPPNRFWIGAYGSRTSGTNAWNFNKQSQSSVYDVATVLEPETGKLVDNVVIGVNSTDSGFSLCWYNVKYGTDIGMDNGMGEVADTGAIKIEAAASSSTEIVAKNDKSTYFSLYKVDNTGKETQIYAPKFDAYLDSWTYSNLIPDQLYRVKSSSDSQVTQNVKYQDVYTYIDPRLDAKKNEINIRTTGDAVVLTDAEDSYQYCIKDSSANVVVQWASPKSGVLTLGGLIEKTTYYLYAKSEINTGSDAFAVKTTSSLEAEPISSTKIRVKNISGMAFSLLDLNKNVIREAKTYTEDTFYYENLTSDTQYTVVATDGTNEKTKDIITWLNPLKRQDQVDVLYISTEEYIKLEGAEKNYTYYLTDPETGLQVGQYMPNTQLEVNFPNLTKNKDYILTAWVKSNPYSDAVTVGTHPSFTVEPGGPDSFKVTLTTNDISNYKIAVYPLTSETPIYDFFVPTSQTITFKNSSMFKADTVYRVKMKPAQESSATWVETKEFRTFINPDTWHGESYSVNYYYANNRIMLENADKDYQYGICETQAEDASHKYKYIMADQVTGKVTFNSLDDESVLKPNTTYYIRAKRFDGSNNNSIVKTVATHPDFEVTAQSDSSIKVNKGNSGYEYCVYLNGGLVSSWKTDISQAFTGLTYSDREYTIYQRSSAAPKDSNVEHFSSHTCKTFIDPQRKSDGISPITIYKTINKIALQNYEPTYAYAVYSGNEPTDKDWKTGSSTYIIFDNLNANTAYKIKAKSTVSGGNINSVVKNYTTFQNVTPTADSSSQISFYGYANFTYDLFYGSSIVATKSLSSNQNVTMNKLDYSDSDYTLKIHYKGVPSEIYDQRTVHTYIDPERKRDGNKILVFTNIEKITLRNTDKDYYYSVYKVGGSPSTWKQGSGSSTIDVVFTKLDDIVANTTYCLVAKRTDFDKSDVKNYTTHLDFELTCNSSNSITTQVHVGYYYALFIEGQESPIVSWATYSDQTTEKTYTGLESDRTYYVKARINENDIPDEKTIKTYIDPELTYNHEDVIIFQNINSITVYGIEKTYTYTLSGEGQTQTKSGLGLTEIKFEGLTANKEYTLTAKSSANPNSDKKVFHTHKDYSTSAQSSRQIIVNGNAGYEYAIVEDGEIKGNQWLKPDVQGHVTFSSLLYPDTIYTVYAREEGDTRITDARFYDSKKETTWIDVMRKAGSKLQTTKIYKNINYITLEYLDTNYAYAIKTAGYSTDYTEPDNTGKIVFNGLDQNKTYTLYACHKSVKKDENCDTTDITTFKDFEPKSSNSKTISFKGWKDFKYEIYLDSGPIITDKTALNDGETITFTNLDFSDTVYKIRSSYTGYDKAYYDIRSDRTWIDPARRSNGSSEVKMYQNINKITLTNSDSAYIYILSDGKGFTKEKPGTNDTPLVFDSLDENTQYTLKAKSTWNTNSDTVKLKTHPSFDVTPNKQTTIDISKASTNYDFALFLASSPDTPVINWSRATSANFTYSFTVTPGGEKVRLKSDTKYIVKMKETGQTDFIPDEIEVTTWIDVLRKQGETQDTTEIYKNINYITLENLDTNYAYAIKSTGYSTDYTEPDNTGKIVFDNLDDNKSYTLYASHKTVKADENCDTADITTFKDFSPKSSDASTISFEGWKGFKYEIYIDGPQIKVVDSITATSDKQLVEFDDLDLSDTEYSIRSSYVTYNKPYYDIRTARTYIDPTRQADGKTPIKIYKNIHKITLKACQPTYFYALSTAEGGTPIGGWKQPSGADNKVVFDSLDYDTTYYLFAKTQDYENSEYHDFTTHKDYSLEHGSPQDSQIIANINPDYSYALFERENGIDTQITKYEDFGTAATHTYSQLKNDMLYIVKAWVPDEGDDFIPDEREIYTYILPLETRYHGSVAPTEVGHTALEVIDQGEKKYSIKLDNVEPAYSYALFKDNVQISTYKQAGSTETSVVLDTGFSGNKIEPDTTYRLVAIRDGINENCMPVYLTTIGKDLKFLPASSVSADSELCDDYYYKLEDESGKVLIDWWKQEGYEEKYHYSNLIVDSKYKLYCKKTLIDTPNISTIYTKTDPWLKADKQTMITIYCMADYITLYDVDEFYEYQLYEFDGTQLKLKQDWTPTVKVEGSQDIYQLTFTGLDAGFPYVINAKNTYHEEDLDYFGSDNVELFTHDVLTANVNGDNGHEEFHYEYDDDVTKYGADLVGIVSNNIYKDSILTFGGSASDPTGYDTFTLYYETDKGFYHINYEVQAFAMSGYEFDYWTYKGNIVKPGEQFTVADKEFNIVAHYKHLYSTTNITAGTGHGSFDYDYSIYEYGKSTQTSDSVAEYNDDYSWVNTTYSFNGDTFTSKYSDTSLAKDTTSTTVKAVPYSGYLFDHWEYWSIEDEEMHPVEDGIDYTLISTDDKIELVAYYRHDVVNLKVSGENGHVDFDWTLTVNGDTTEGPDETFENDSIWVNTTYSFEGNTITYSYEDEFDETQSLDITANEYDGYIFDHWELDGSEVDEGTTYTVESGSDIEIVAIYRHDAINITINGENGLETLAWSHDISQAYPQVSLSEEGKDKEYTYDSIWTNTEINFDYDTVTVTYEDTYNTDSTDIEVQALPFDGYIFDHWIINEDEANEEEAFIVESGQDVEITAYYRHELAGYKVFGNNGHDNFSWEYKIETTIEDKSNNSIFSSNNTSTTGLVPENKSGTDKEYSYDKLWNNSVFTFNENKINIKYADSFETDYFNSEITANQFDGYLFEYWTLNGQQVIPGQTSTIDVDDNWSIEAHYKHDLASALVSGSAGHGGFSLTTSGQAEISSGTLKDVTLDKLWVNSTYKFEDATLTIDYQDSFGQDNAQYKIIAKPANGYEFVGWTLNNSNVSKGGENKANKGASDKIVANYKFIDSPAELPMLEEFEDEGGTNWMVVASASAAIAAAGGAAIYFGIKRRKKNSN